MLTAFWTFGTMLMLLIVVFVLIEIRDALHLIHRELKKGPNV
jgi:hypothetical protein